MRKKKVEIKIIQETRPYVLWKRVSTREQGTSGLGLEAQYTIAKIFMGREPVEVFTDVHTGTKLRQCVGLWQAIDLCKENDYVLVIAKTDRCRNVQEALEILDAVGERNLIFCDLPSCDRFILTIMFAMHERTAQIGRINTKIALAERKKQIEEDGGFFSKNGNWTTHLGRNKGCDTSSATRMSARVAADKAREWRESSALYTLVALRLYQRVPRKKILDEARNLYKMNPEKYCTRDGKVLSEGLLSRYAKEILREEI